MSADTTRKSGYGELFRHRGFSLLWASTIVNGLGNGITYIALPLYVYQLSGSFLSLGLTFFFETFPWVLLGPLAGVWSDRFDRKHLIVWTSVGQGIVIAIAPFMASPAAIYAISLVSTTLFVLSTPARAAVAPEVVGKELFPRAVAVSQTTQQALQVAGPFLGGAVVAAITPRYAFFLDAVSFVLAAGLIGLVAIPQIARRPAVAAGSSLAQFRDGLACLWNHPELRWATLISIPGMATLGALLSLTPAFVQVDLGRGPEMLGFLNGLFSVGVVVAGFAAVKLQEKTRPMLLLALGTIIFGAALLPLGFLATAVAAIFLWIVSGLGRGIASTVSQVIFALKTPVELRGRVFSLANALTMAGRMLGSLAAGFLAEAIGVRDALVALGALSVVCALPALARNRASYPQPQEEAQAV